MKLFCACIKLHVSQKKWSPTKTWFEQRIQKNINTEKLCRKKGHE